MSLHFQKKIETLVLLFTLLFIVDSHAQQTEIVLTAPESGNIENFASEKVEFKDDYHYSPTGSNQMHAFIDHALATNFQYGLLNGDNFVLDNDFTGTYEGVTNGQLNVTPTGGATYSIPLELPKGTGNLAPTLSVQYSSQAGNGMLGMGWSLGGLSAITRTQKNYFDDNEKEAVQIEWGDALMLDGQRLINTNGSIYKTSEETYVRVTAMGSYGEGPEWFRVETKSGLIKEYGKTNDSRFLTEEGTSCLQWKINKIIDPNGNYIEFIYRNENRQNRITEIRYTGNENVNLEPYQSIKFYYMKRSDVTSSFVGGSEIRSNYLIRKISITGEFGHYKDYEFDYGYLPNSLYSFLNNIRESNAGKTKWKNPIQFKYNLDDLSFSTSSRQVNSGWSLKASGDFNGDGHSDIVYNYDDPNTNQPGFWLIETGDGYGNFSQYESGSLLSGYQSWDSRGNYRTFSMIDFFGDGSEDLLNFKISSSIQSINGVDTTWSTYLEGVEIIRFGDFGASAPLELIDQPLNVGDNKPFYVGDFDGNGKQDILVLYKEGNYYKGKIFSNNEYTSSFSLSIDEYDINLNRLSFIPDNNEFMAVCDFDGDGKSELFTQNDFYSGDQSWEIFEFSKNSGGTYDENQIFSKEIDNDIMSTLRFGDFNGDGKSDLLVGANTGVEYLNTDTWITTSTEWSLLLSSGVDFISRSFNMDAFLGVKPRLSISDFNGDGRTDILVRKAQLNGISVDINYQYLMNLIGYWEVHSELHTEGRKSDVIGEFQGDGRMDILIQNSSGKQFFHSFDEGEVNQKLVEIKDGIDRHFTINYDFLMKTDYDLYHTSFFSGPDGRYPMMNFTGPLPVVTTLEQPDGVNGIAVSEYQYDKGLFHNLGRGFMGFADYKKTDYSKDVSIRQISSVNKEYFQLLPKRQEKRLHSTSELVEEKIFEDVEIEGLSPGNRRKVEINEIRSENHLTGVYTIEQMIYDNYGNITKKIVQNNHLLKIIENDYIQVEAWIPSRIERVEETIDRNIDGSSAQTIKRIEYYTDGKLKNEVVNDYLTNAIRSEYKYDNLGNLTEERQIVPGHDDIWKKYSYDIKGRLLTAKENHLGQEETYSNNDLFGLAKETVNDLGLIQKKQYDSFGRLIQAENSRGVESFYTYNWDVVINSAASETSPDNHIYYLKKQKSGAPTVMTWKDRLGRNVKQVKSGLSGDICTITKYNAKRQVISETSPFFVGDASNAVYSIMSYDQYGRKELISNSASNATISMAYAYDQGITEETTTSPTGTVTKYYDAIGKVIKSIDDGGELIHTYDNFGRIIETSLNGNSITNMEYDDYGNQTLLEDKNAGTTNYEYDALGRLIKQKDANGSEIIMEYDSEGRLIKKIVPEGTINYTYFSSGNGKYKLKSVVNYNGVKKEYEYDQYQRITRVTTTVDGQSYLYEYDYNANDQKTVITYPSGYMARKIYNNEGFLIRVEDAQDNTIFYELPEKNAYGQLSSYKLGNGKTSVNTYTDQGFPLNFFASGVQDLSMHFDEETGNLLSRTDHLAGIKETFSYDQLDRLTTSEVENIMTNSFYSPVEINYEDNGNISSKSDAGNYTYDNNKNNAVVNIESQTGSISQLMQEVTYTQFDRPATIQEGNRQLFITYNSNQNRVKTEHYENNSLSYTKLFLGSYEEVTENGTTKKVHYLPAPQGNVVLIEENGNRVVRYLYKDHLGTPVVVTDEQGDVVIEQNFDAWGRRRDPSDWTYTSTANQPSWLRGYTGHEMLDDFGLVNMNNRLYDPVVGRMLSVDNYVQDEHSSQSYNRYSYALNNPLKYTDPSGEIIAFTDFGYEFWKYISPIAIKINLNFNADDSRIGLDVSAGLPQIVGINVRAQAGVSYHFGTKYNSYKGWEGRYGFEVGVNVFGFQFKSAMTYYDFEGGKFDQRNNMITIGSLFVNFKYENDYMFNLMFGLEADGGDRYRTAAGRLSIGYVNVGFNLYTGDPGLNEKDRFHPKINGQETYAENESGDDPDEFRFGGLYVSLGGIQIGVNSENVRHAIQNVFAHDIMYSLIRGNKLPHFAIDRSKNPTRFHWNIGTGTGNTLW